MEKNIVSIFFFLLLPLVMASNVSLFDSTPKNPSSYSYFWLVHQWPPSLCNTQKCAGQVPKQFTLHGLWPQYNNTNSHKYPKDCPSKIEFDPREIKSIETHLNQDWPDLERGNNTDFWKKQWNKHGKCASLTPEQYFKTASTLKRKHDLLQIISKILYDPNHRPRGTYDLTQIAAAISNVTKGQPILKCNQSEKKSQLWEIILCVNGKGTDIISCTTDAKKEKTLDCPNNSVGFPL